MATGSGFTVTPAISVGSIAADLGMESAAGMGVFLSAGYWGLALVMLFSGWLGERIGLRYLLLLSGLVQFCGLWLVAGAQNLAEATAASFLAGSGRGLTPAPMNAVLCAIYPRARAKVTAILHANFYLGMIVLVLLLLTLHELAWSWRETFRLLAVVVLSYGVAALFVPVPPATAAVDRGVRPPLRKALRHPAFLLLCAAMFFSGATEVGPLTWAPYFIEQVAGGTKTAGIVALLALGVTMSFGRIFGVRLIERMGIHSFFLAAAPFCAVSLALAAMPTSTLFTIACLNALALGVSCFFPTLVSYAANRFPDGGATMFAVLTMVAVVGAFTGPLCIGIVADAFGLETAMALLALAPLACLGFMLAVRRTESHSVSHEQMV